MNRSIDAVYAEVVKRIVNERKKQGITQERLAAMSDVDRTHMGLIEQGRRRPTLATLYKLSNALKLTLEHLFRNL
jgi:transcriptional regulator with XRE-family HTH domain